MKNPKKTRTEKKAKKIGWFLGLHHILPTSRGGDNNETNLYPRDRWKPYSKKHREWHVIFVNMTPREVINAIKQHIKSDGSLNEEFFKLGFSWEEATVKGRQKWVINTRKSTRKSERKKKAWRTLFDDWFPTDAIEWIEREFIRKEWMGS